jgi:hypothetical protein
LRIRKNEFWKEGRRERLRSKEHEQDEVSQLKLESQLKKERDKTGRRNYYREKANAKACALEAEKKAKDRRLHAQTWDDFCTKKRDVEKEFDRDKLNREHWQAALSRMFSRWK